MTLEHIKDILDSGLLELYAMGETTPSETTQVEQWLVQYPEVKAELEGIELSLEAYAQANAIQPSVKVKDVIFSTIKNNDGRAEENVTKGAPVIAMQSANNKSLHTWKMAAAACTVLMLGSGVYNVMQHNKYTIAQNDFKKQEQELLAMQKEKQDMDKAMDAAFSSDSRSVNLKGMPASPTSNAKIFWMENTGDVYVDATGLPEAPKGKQYQLWAIINGTPQDAGMILQGKDGKKYRIQKMKKFGKADAFGITLEKEGGAAKPDMNQLYVMANT